VTDQILLERLRSGDEQAFESIFRTHFPALLAFAERMLRQRAVAEEIVQEVFLEIWKRRATLELTESFRAYLFRSTRNRCLNELRHDRVVRRTAPLHAPGVSEPVATGALEEAEIADALDHAMKMLPPRCREVFELSRDHGLKYAEIAATLGISVKTVEAQMGKALKLLRDQLAPWLPGGDRSSGAGGAA
jgi:RNA polymerase sigma-70 factor, ECF subfamily